MFLIVVKAPVQGGSFILCSFCSPNDKIAAREVEESTKEGALEFRLKLFNCPLGSVEFLDI